MTPSRYKLHAALMGAACLVLAGCTPTDTPGALSLAEGASTSEPTPLLAARLARGQIVVSGPEGYCIDPTSLRSTAAGGFAAIASCNILSSGRGGPFVEPVLVTVTVSRATNGSPSLTDLASALQTDLLQERDLSGLRVGQMVSGGEAAFAGSDPKHWRGAFVLDSHLVGVALYAPVGSPLIGAQGAAFLNTVSSRIRARSATSRARSAEQSQSPVDPLETRLGRLFERGDL